MREYCEALGYVYGYKFLNHEVITFFLKDILEENSIANKFDKYRKLRNGINYYGNDVDLETVKLAIKEIPGMINLLGKYLK